MARHRCAYRDVVLVTKDGNRNMSEKLPRTVEQLKQRWLNNPTA